MKFASRLLEHPVRVADAQMKITAVPQSQAVVHLLERKDGKLVVVAWLRSSTPGEVKDHSGRAVDRRRERVGVTLPCAVGTVWTFDVQGRVLGVRHPRRRDLDVGIVRGDRVSVDEVQCER